MANTIYPAIFHREEDGRYSVEFPDIPGCLTAGNTLEEAFKMAKEALAVCLEDAKVEPTALEKIKTEGDDRAMLVEADSTEDIVYFKKSDVPRVFEEGLESKGYTKYQAAMILGVDRSYLTRIAKGDRVPSVDMAKRIGTLLGFDWKVFYTEGTGTV